MEEITRHDDLCRGATAESAEAAVNNIDVVWRTWELGHPPAGADNVLVGNRQEVSLLVGELALHLRHFLRVHRTPGPRWISERCRNEVHQKK